jgi:hypothetical protein
MKLPALVEALAAGIALAGPQPMRTPVWLAPWLAPRSGAAGILGLVAWLFLGAAGARREQRAR